MHEISIKITINEKNYEKNIQANTLLIDFLREELNLTGSHIGCDTSQCGACMVRIKMNYILCKMPLEIIMDYNVASVHQE